MDKYISTGSRYTEISEDGTKLFFSEGYDRKLVTNKREVKLKDNIEKVGKEIKNEKEEIKDEKKISFYLINSIVDRCLIVYFEYVIINHVLSFINLEKNEYRTAVSVTFLGFFGWLESRAGSIILIEFLIFIYCLLLIYLTCKNKKI